MSQAASQRVQRSDRLVVGAAWVLAAAGAGLGVRGEFVAIAAAVLPIGAAVVLGHVPGRGGAVGCLALALGSALIRPTGGAFPAIELAVLGMIAATATIGAGFADRLAPTAEPIPNGRWVTIVVACEGPSDMAPMPDWPPASPRSDPERRRIRRLVERGRKPVTTG